MERMLLAAALKGRASQELISAYITLNKYSRPFQIVWDLVANYYKRDEDSQEVQPEILLALIGETVRNDKHVAQFTEMINEAVATDVSEVNVQQVVLEAKRTELADELAMALTNGKEHDELIETYLAVKAMTSLDELDEQGTEELDATNMADILAQEADRTGALQLYPLAINDRTDGGVRGGDHIVVFARPETGKTALCISIASGFARQGAVGIYFGNEDRPQKLLLRLISNLIGWNRRQILDNVDEALELANKEGLGNVKIVSLAPGTPAVIEAYIKKTSPRWIIIDQLRNIAVKADSRVNQLEAAATVARNLGKKYNLVVVSVTQAGDSAANKEILEMGDVDFSNTGIPAAADMMIGMGVTPAMEQQGIRMISLPKNKIGGDHGNFAVRLDQFLSRVMSIR